ncbi:MAG TPA: ankyrin repeat domain-containing protein [Candidatus Eisenbacteria bacterium]|nr:ankyrin repeat domain-containing protein [Candidatus Eisenbacteria bacterium]
MPKPFYDRHFPVHPNLEQLRHQAKDLLQDLHQGEPRALALWQIHRSDAGPSSAAKLADAQFVLARMYGIASWLRMATACRLIDAIWRGDVDEVRQLIVKNSKLLSESATGVPDSNWGPPMTYAANIGQDAIIEMLHELGAEDVQHAFSRACLQGKIETARRLQAMGGRITLGIVMGPCETLDDAGLALQLELGAMLADDKGNRLAPVALILQTYSRNPEGKHGCLELVAKHGIELPDTPVMALHRGRLDLLEKQFQRDPSIISRNFPLAEIYPLELGCGPDLSYGLHGTPLDGTTLLHICVEYDEIETACWLIEHGADVNARADIDSEGFGGHTPLFGCVVNNSYLCGRQRDGAFARLLLDHGADPNARASIRKQIHFIPDESMHEYRDITPLDWGQQFHGQRFHNWVSKEAMQLISERGGHR